MITRSPIDERLYEDENNDDLIFGAPPAVKTAPITAPVTTPIAKTTTLPVAKTTAKPLAPPVAKSTYTFDPTTLGEAQQFYTAPVTDYKTWEQALLNADIDREKAITPNKFNSKVKPQTKTNVVPENYDAWVQQQYNEASRAANEALRSQYTSALTGQLSNFWSQNQIDPNIRGINRADELAQILSHFGISDLSQVGLKATQRELPGEWVTGYQNDNEIQQWVDPRTETQYQLTYGDKTFGDLGGFDSNGNPVYLNTPPQQYLQDLGNNTFRIAGSAAGKGVVDYIAKFTPEGKLQSIVPQWKSSSDLGSILPILSILAIPFTGGLSASLGTALGSQVAGQIAANALVQGTLGGLGSEAAGGSFGKGFGKGALTGGIGAGISTLVSPAVSGLGKSASDLVGGGKLGELASGAVTGAAKSGIGALVTGSGLKDSLVSGALGGAAGAGVGLVGGEIRDLLSDVPKPIQDAAVAAVTSGLTGKDPLQAAIRAGVGSAVTGSNKLLPGTEVDDAELLEDFFAPGGGGFAPDLSPEEVKRETDSLLARYPAPTDIPDWDISTAPTGKLEQDFYVNERGQIVDSAGNVGTFVGEDFVPDTGITPDRTGYTPTAPATKPATKPATEPQAPTTPAPAAPQQATGGDDFLSALLAMGLLGGMGQRPQQEEKNEFEAGPSLDLARLFGHTEDPATMEQLMALIGQAPRG